MVRQPGTTAGLGLLALAVPLFFRPAVAVPHPKDDVHDAGFGFLMPRDCVQYCGYNNMYCCGTGQECYTTNDIAGCRNTAAGGGYNLYTTTWTETETFTSTFTSVYPAATTGSSETCIPEEGSGQVACGSICCANWQYCAYDGQCASNTAWVGATPTATAGAGAPTTGGVVVTTSYEPAFRVTGSGTATGTAASATASDASTTSGNKLSGGAIAGIVIGSIVGAALLLGLCACFLVRGLWHGVLALLGIRKNRDREEVVVEEERRHRTSGASRHGSWYGGRPASASLAEKEKHSGSKWLGLGAAAGTLLLLLGLRRKERVERVERVERRRSRSRAPSYSETNSSYYDYSDPSYVSRQSGTRASRVSRRSDPSRVSYASRPSRQSRSRR